RGGGEFRDGGKGVGTGKGVGGCKESLRVPCESIFQSRDAKASRTCCQLARRAIGMGALITLQCRELAPNFDSWHPACCRRRGPAGGNPASTVRVVGVRLSLGRRSPASRAARQVLVTVPKARRPCG